MGESNGEQVDSHSIGEGNEEQVDRRNVDELLAELEEVYRKYWEHENFPKSHLYTRVFIEIRKLKKAKKMDDLILVVEDKKEEAEVDFKLSIAFWAAIISLIVGVFLKIDFSSIGLFIICMIIFAGAFGYMILKNIENKNKKRFYKLVNNILNKKDEG